MDLQTRKVSFSPSSLDEGERTFEAVASSGAPVRRNGYTEVLDVNGVRAETGVPVLDTHKMDDLTRVLGVVTDWRRENSALIAKVRLSERASGILSDIKAGILKNISLGYVVHKWTDSRNAEGLVRTASAWEVRELSIVPLGADQNATIRASAPCAEEEKVMPNPETVTTEDAAAVVPEITNRAEINAEIRRIAALSHLGQGWVDQQIDACSGVAEAKEAAFAAMAARPQVRASVGWSASDPAFRNNAIADGAFAAISGKEPSEAGRAYTHVRGFHDLARESLSLSGIRTQTLSDADLITRGLSTSDFPAILGNVVSRFVLAGYSEQPAPLLSLTTQQLVPNFKDITLGRVHGPGRLTRKNEYAEIEYSYLNEEYQTAAVATYAGGLEFSRETLINDDRGAFVDVAMRLGIAARDEESLQAVALLDQNSRAGPTLADGEYLFSTSHSNISSSPAGPDDAHITAARLALRHQTDTLGRRIGLTPSAVLVPAELETSVEKLLTAIQATSVSDVNVFSFLTLVTEARLTGTTRWYVVSRDIPGLVVLRLEGRAGPQVESQIDFNTKSVRYSVLNDFAIAVGDWRPWYADGVAS